MIIEFLYERTDGYMHIKDTHLKSFNYNVSYFRCENVQETHLYSNYELVLK